MDEVSKIYQSESVKIYKDLEQGSKEWFNARAGIVTASESIKKYLLAGKKGFETFVLKKYAEKFLEKKWTPNVGGWAKRGQDLEPDAILAYEEETLNKTDLVGFIKNTHYNIGCSPDAVIRDNNGDIIKGVEAKCFEESKHIEAIISGQIHEDVMTQVQFSLLVTGLKEWDVVYYNPDMKPGYKLFIQTVKYDTLIGIEIIARLKELHDIHVGFEKNRIKNNK